MAIVTNSLKASYEELMRRYEHEMYATWENEIFRAPVPPPPPNVSKPNPLLLLLEDV